MDFGLSEERVMLRDMLARVLAERWDHEARRALLASDAAYDAALFGQLAELGILGALFPEQDGGFGGAGFDIAVVFEELGRAGLIAPILGSAVLAGSLTDLRRAEVLDGSHILAVAHSEPQARYDLAHVTTSFQDGRLTGVKSHVLDGAEAGTLIVSARTSGAVSAEDGLSLFTVASDAAGLTITAHRNIDGTAAARVVLDQVPAEPLGDAGTAYPAIERAVARATLAVCAEALGAMETAKALTIAYLKDRKQFGKPIGSFQALQHRMADVLIEVEQARSAVINLAGALDAPRAARERHVSATKNLVGRVGTLVAEECIQMHGGIAMTEEYALSHYARRLVMIDHLFGDSDHHLERFIALGAA